jgi:N-methylhydantoinase B
MNDNRSGQAIDAVSLGIMWDRLIAITDEILTAIVRTAFSVGVREAWDLACVAFDREGRAIAQGTLSMPAFIGTAPLTMKHMLAKYPAEMLRPGDVLVTNDPWLGTGHTPDICVARPVFRDDRVVGFIMTITHLPDVGGAGLAIGNPDLYHEGLILPVCKLVEAGEPNALVYDILEGNVRVADEVMGDVEANVTGTAVGARLMGEFMEEYGLTDLQALADGIIAQSETALRRELATIPDGVYRNAAQIETVTEALDLACAVTIEGDHAEIDFAGSGPAQPVAINVPLCYTKSFATYAMKCLTTPGIPNNEGTVRPLSVSAPAGSILNAQKPSPTGGRHTVGWFIVPLIMGALAGQLPDRVQADSGMATLILVNTTRPDGREVATQYFLAGGLGAMDGKDGQHAVPFPTNNAVVPTEVWERETGMRVLYRRLVPDTGGPGTFRGGVGQEAALRNDSERVVSVSLFGLRTRFPARGFAGGRDGARRRFAINGEEIPPKGRFDLRPGDTLVIREAGGGGFGDPGRRDPRALAADMAAGLATQEGIARDYGIPLPTRPASAE